MQIVTKPDLDGYSNTTQKDLKSKVVERERERGRERRKERREGD